MNPLTALIIEEEKHALDVLRWELAQHTPEVQILDTCSSVKDVRSAIASLKPDMIFSEVILPRMDAFDLFSRLPRPFDFQLIFVSAYDSFAIQALRVGALDYLLKPVDGGELKSAIRKVHQKKTVGASFHSNYQLRKALPQAFLPQAVALPTQNGYEFVMTEQILRCEADNNYTLIYLKEGKKFIVSKSLKYMEKLLQAYSFFRIHKCHIINLRYIQSYIKGEGGQIVLQDGTTLGVARSRKEHFLNMFRVTRELAV